MVQHGTCAVQAFQKQQWTRKCQYYGLSCNIKSLHGQHHSPYPWYNQDEYTIVTLYGLSAFKVVTNYTTNALYDIHIYLWDSFQVSIFITHQLRTFLIYMHKPKRQRRVHTYQANPLQLCYNLYISIGRIAKIAK